MAVKKHMHYFCSASNVGKKGFTPSKTTPGQGFRPREIVSRMMAGAPPPVGRNPVYINPDYGVDPLARFDVPIEEMAEKARLAQERLDALIAAREEAKKTAAAAAVDAPDPPELSA